MCEAQNTQMVEGDAFDIIMGLFDKNQQHPMVKAVAKARELELRINISEARQQVLLEVIIPPEILPSWNDWEISEGSGLAWRSSPTDIPNCTMRRVTW